MTTKESQEVINACSNKGISAKINCCERTIEYYVLDKKDDKDKLVFRVTGEKASKIIIQARFVRSISPSDYALSQFMVCAIDFQNNELKRNLFD